MYLSSRTETEPWGAKFSSAYTRVSSFCASPLGHGLCAVCLVPLLCPWRSAFATTVRLPLCSCAAAGQGYRPLSQNQSNQTRLCHGFLGMRRVC